MTETTTTPDASASSAAAGTPRKTGGSLGGKVLAELQEIAAGLGITGAEKMRKGALIDAIKIARGDAGTSTKAAVKAASGPTVADTADAAPVIVPPTKNDADAPAKTEAPKRGGRGRGAKADSAKAEVATSDATADEAPAKAEKPTRSRSRAAAKSDAPAGDDAQNGAEKNGTEKNGTEKNGTEKNGRGGSQKNGPKADAKHDAQPETKNEPRHENTRGEQSDDAEDGEGGRGRGRGRGQNNNGANDRHQQGGGQNSRNQNNQNRNQAPAQNDRHQGHAQDDDEEMGGRRRNRRGRNRNSQGGRGNLDVDTSYTEDDVLVPAAGILDILDNYAFVRTTGYLPSDNDVYVSLSMVRKWGLRRGDAVVGQVRQPREGERKEKFNPMVKIDSVNGMALEEATKRVEFSKLTPLYPSERLRLEGEAGGLAGRVIDLVSPIGKGQRGLIVSPPKAGKTMIMQQIANAITTNNPECHLMIVLVDERPEEVTEFQRTVKGEVIASTFDRPATDHTMVAELAIERAKRLVELGHDVVLLLDGITRLGRAYNLAAPTSGRIMSGGVDSSALYPPKKFFGAARNIEDGGSLTIIATALVETGSRMDEVIFEEFKGTGNWELRLRRDLADKRIFPAVDVDASSTRREELLMSKDELNVVWKLRRVLSGLDSQQGLELVLDKLKKSSNNADFLQKITATLPQDGAAVNG
ncbi:transcription termination factor Rho [Aeromicrobium chenweiae]|uniref:transcription termination factor Rho n=1 Tax=Aeromicrobium chenweiae TaxID=2079793 RepID=UPI0019009EC9|nr:transcription termination factor Rho [Aeromicrobium chenweiae]